MSPPRKHGYDSFTGLVIPVPEANVVQRWRRSYDWSAKHGMGPHITLLFPYVHIAILTARDVRYLRDFFGKANAPTFRFEGTRRFKDYVYLAPEPSTPICRLMKGLRAKYPQCIPYGGMFGGVLPHLTVAFHRNESVLGKIENDLSGVSIKAVADRVQLMECVSERWQVVEEFPFRARDNSPRRPVSSVAARSRFRGRALQDAKGTA